MNEEKYMLLSINIYIKSEDIKKYTLVSSNQIENRMRRELSLYSSTCKVDLSINILPVLSNKSHLELTVNTISIDSDFISNNMFIDGIHNTLVNALPSKIDYFLFRQYKDANFLIVED